MPFRSEKQRRYLWANEPEIARRWTKEHGSRIQKDNGGIMRIPFAEGDVTKEWEIDFHSKDDPELHQKMVTAAEEAVSDYLRKINSGEISMPENLQMEMDKITIKTKIDILKQQSGNDGGGGAKRIGVLGDEGMNLEEFMDERLEERIEKEKRKIEEQLGIGGMGLPSLPKEPFYKEADPGQPVWDMDTNKYYDPITGREIRNPNIPQKRNMDTMPYIKEPFSPIAKRASLTRNKAFDITTGNNEYIKRRQEDEEDNVPLRFKNARYLSDYFNREQNALRRDNRYWNRGDQRTGPQKWMGNIGGNIMGGIRNIGQRVSNFAGNLGNLRQGYSTQAGYNAARQARINQNRVLMRSNPKSLENLKINYARMGLNQDQINQKVQNFQNVTNQISNQSAGNQQTGGNYSIPTRSQNIARTSSRVGPGGNVRAYGLAGGGLASIWPR